MTDNAARQQTGLRRVRGSAIALTTPRSDHKYARHESRVHKARPSAGNRHEQGHLGRINTRNCPDWRQRRPFSLSLRKARPVSSQSGQSVLLCPRVTETRRSNRPAVCLLPQTRLRGSCRSLQIRAASIGSRTSDFFASGVGDLGTGIHAAHAASSAHGHAAAELRAGLLREATSLCSAKDRASVEPPCADLARRHTV